MASWEDIAREESVMRKRRGLDPVYYCHECNEPLFVGHYRFNFSDFDDDEIFCEDCAHEYFMKFRKMIDIEDIKEG